jgi:predicted HicB family RNase H-like nuclease
MFEHVEMKVFPIRLKPDFSELVSSAAKKTPLSKHDWVVQAIKEKLERGKSFEEWR